MTYFQGSLYANANIQQVIVVLLEEVPEGGCQIKFTDLA